MWPTAVHCARPLAQLPTPLSPAGKAFSQAASKQKGKQQLLCHTHTVARTFLQVYENYWKKGKQKIEKREREKEQRERERGSHLASAADKQDKVTRHKVCQRSQRKQIHQPSMRVAGRPKLERMPEQPPPAVSSPHPKPSRARLNNKPLSIRLLFRRSPTQAAPAAIEISWQEFSITMPT